MELREMLELAALAAGLEYECVSHTGYPKHDQHQVRNEQGSLIDWNPHTDDGDSRRLAVALKIDVKPDYTYEGPWGDGGKLRDPYAATRMAVLRCAAEIGKSMKEKSE